MSRTLIPSIFNDVIGPVMRGPSSSHSAASVRIGRLVYDLCGGTPDRVVIDYDSRGSLATTHESQGTDMGLYGGLLGWEPDDSRLPTSPSALRAAGTSIEVRTPRLDDPHPNTYRIHVERETIQHDVVALSTGGGMIELVSIDGVPLTLFGDYSTTVFVVEQDPQAIVDFLAQESDVDTVTICGEGPWLVLVCADHFVEIPSPACNASIVDTHRLGPVLPVLSRRETAVPFSHASQLVPAERLEAAPLSDWAIKYEMARGNISEAEVLAQAQRMIDVMRRGVETGLAGTEYADRILGWQSGRFVALDEAGKLLDGGLLNKMIAYVTALMEAKSAMEVIVAAPTAGSCATFPGALLATVDSLEATPAQVQRALLTGGLIGVFTTNRSSFAAELGGCQAETGAGAAMAAAALVELAGGSAAQSLSAASQSLQNVLGLICDPVGNRVEAPCLGRNVSGAANALSCANMALAGYDHVIPLDEVLDAHKQVSDLMARELRCTGLAGLAATPTARRVEVQLSVPR
jgi:L-serine dehydratase